MGEIDKKWIILPDNWNQQKRIIWKFLNCKIHYVNKNSSAGFTRRYEIA